MKTTEQIKEFMNGDYAARIEDDYVDSLVVINEAYEDEHDDEMSGYEGVHDLAVGYAVCLGLIDGERDHPVQDAAELEDHLDFHIDYFLEHVADEVDVNRYADVASMRKIHEFDIANVRHYAKEMRKIRIKEGDNSLTFDL